MIKLEKYQTYGWEEAIRGMRNPMNSWEKSDSVPCYFGPHEPCTSESCGLFDNGCNGINYFWIGERDRKLMMNLRNAGTDHRKFMRMITVYVDITAPLYWWKEFDTYKVGTVANSCSTMHKLTEKAFTMEDFSHEFLTHYDFGDDWVDFKGELENMIFVLNEARQLYLRTKDQKVWYQMIQLLPTSYNQKRTVMLNYEVLANIFKSRRNHKLEEWRHFCDWIATLPYSEIITGGEE